MSSYPPIDPSQPSLAARFDGRSDAYKLWRDQRLLSATLAQNTVIALPIDALFDDAVKTEVEESGEKAIEALCKQMETHGFVLYRFTGPDPATLTLEQSQAAVGALARKLGLNSTDDGVIRDLGRLSLLKDLSGTPRGRFIPYTNRAMNWHTDGYYNDANSIVRCFTLHCVCPASEGGSLTVMDPELLLIALQEGAPGCVDELARENAMLLPANADDQGHDRPDRKVPIFFMGNDGALGMRFTTRAENIRWHSVITAAAAEQVADMIHTCRAWHTQVRLHSGEGIITRNVLHQRGAFVDNPGSPGRQVLRGRYLQLPQTAHSGHPASAEGGPSHAARE